QGIVKQSGGEISVQSTVGLGTRFTLTFPASEQRLDDLTVARAAVGGSETLLVVEDEPLVRRTSVRALRLAGYRVREAECAEDALRILEEPDEVIHLLLTDVMMPGMNGRELAERVQLTKPAMRVLLMSGFTDDAAVRQGIAERTLRLLPKPFSVQALLDAVRRTLDTALV
ncbi:MAG: response regulator, partial [Gemmatimonadaceae bacterium]|nr:response regulator [Gemmatimonadaceae bacterium]